MFRVKNHEPGFQAKSVRDMLHTVSSKGLGEVPQGSLHGPVTTQSTSNGTGPPHSNGTLHRKPSNRKAPGKVPEHVQDRLGAIEKGLSSNEWRERSDGVQEFESLANQHPKVIGQNSKVTNKVRAVIDHIGH